MSRREKILTALSSTLAVALIATLVFTFRPSDDTLLIDTDDEIPQAFPTKTVDVKDYGAKGDGVTDDTDAIMDALNALPPTGGTLFFSKPDDAYVITSTIPLRSNINYVGEGSKIFMDSKTSGDVMLGGSSEKSNILIQGLHLSSVNDLPGRSGSYYEGQYTSNVSGIKFSRTSDLTIQDVVCDQFLYGFKMDSADNKNIVIDNFKVTNTMTGGYISNSTNVTVTNSYFDCTGSTNTHLHNVYISLNTFDVKFDNCYFTNTPGAGLHLYHPTAALDGGEFTNLTFVNTTNALYATNNVKNIKMDNFITYGVRYPIRLKASDGFEITNGYINLTGHAFYVDRTDNVTIKDIFIDGSTTTESGRIITLDGTGHTFENIIAVNLIEDTRLVFSSNRSTTNTIIQNNIFIQDEPSSNYAIQVRDAEHNMTFKANYFLNEGSTTNYLAYDPNCNNVVFEDNILLGYNATSVPSDSTTVIDSTNITKASIETSKGDFTSDSSVNDILDEFDYQIPDKDAFGSTIN